MWGRRGRHASGRGRRGSPLRRPGNDVLYATGAGEIVHGRDGDDQIFGTQGRNTLEGSAGDDRLIGRAGADWFSGGPGSDVILGGKGKDAIEGDDGDDVLSGGVGMTRSSADEGTTASEADKVEFFCSARSFRVETETTGVSAMDGETGSRAVPVTTE